ncbi:unnamed protein product [Pleuronectes platessa]|uniref:Uncharacterized protein n=1 Tax=Pleuronectes platessa TaxID=8262 RepID=A0A9N7UF95_PLEPL|nr:unnamed protein product [Pleuronectes platessa]
MEVFSTLFSRRVIPRRPPAITVFSFFPRYAECIRRSGGITPASDASHLRVSGERMFHDFHTFDLKSRIYNARLSCFFAAPLTPANPVHVCQADYVCPPNVFSGASANWIIWSRIKQSIASCRPHLGKPPKMNSLPPDAVISLMKSQCPSLIGAHSHGDGREKMNSSTGRRPRPPRGHRARTIKQTAAEETGWRKSFIEHSDAVHWFNWFLSITKRRR